MTLTSANLGSGAHVLGETQIPNPKPVIGRLESRRLAERSSCPSLDEHLDLGKSDSREMQSSIFWQLSKSFQRAVSSTVIFEGDLRCLPTTANLSTQAQSRILRDSFTN